MAAEVGLTLMSCTAREFGSPRPFIHPSLPGLGPNRERAETQKKPCTRTVTTQWGPADRQADGGVMDSETSKCGGPRFRTAAGEGGRSRHVTLSPQCSASGDFQAPWPGGYTSLLFIMEHSASFRVQSGCSPSMKCWSEQLVRNECL